MLCFKTYKHSGNTSNFIQHIQNVHGKLLDINKNKKKARVDTRDNEPEVVEVLSDKQEEQNIRQLLKQFLCCLIKDNRPAECVDDEGFKNLMREICPRYQVPHPSTFKRKISEVFEKAVTYLHLRFQGVKYFAITSDAWTDPMNTRSYLGITVHCIRSFAHQSYILSITELEECHTAEYLKTKMQDILNFWGIDKNKVIAGVTDNAANAKKSIELLLGKDKHLSCFAHSLNLLAKDIIEEVTEFQDIITKVKMIVTFCHRSNIAAITLEKEQRKIDPDVVLKLIQEVPTRWNSMYCMVERFLKLKDAVALTLQNT